MKAILSILFLLFAFQKASALINWSDTPVTISTPGVNATSVKVGIDANGDMVAVWLENGFLKASVLPAGGSWSTPTTVSTGGAAASPELVVDSMGNATVIWKDDASIQTANQPFGGAWSTPTTFASSGGSQPGLYVDGSGNLVAIWAVNGAIETSTKLNGGNWSATPDVLAASGASEPQVAIGSSGQVFAVWHNINAVSGMDAIYSSSKTISGNWSTAVVVSDATQNCRFPQIAVDSSGNGVAIWYRYSLIGTQYTNVVLQSSTYEASGFSWSTPVDLSSAGIQNPADLQAAVVSSSAGNALAVWTNSMDGSNYTTSSAFLGMNGSWTTSNNILTDLYDYSFSISIDPAGDVYLVYMQYDYSSSSIIIQNALSILDGVSANYWATNGSISAGNQNGYPNVAITSSASSNLGVAAWTSYDGSNLIIQAVTGSGTPIEPPTGLTVVQNETNYGVVQQYANTVSWVASPSSSVGLYLVYRNGILIQNVPSYMVSIVDSNAVADGTVTYGVASVDQYTGEVSSVVSINYP